MEQLGLAAVIAVVGHCDLRGSPLLCRLFKRLISRSAPGFFLRDFLHAGSVPYLCPGQEKRDSSLLAELLHIPGIFSGLRANAVIHMHYGNVCRYFLLPFQQQK